jgi:hypothetical protein
MSAYAKPSILQLLKTKEHKGTRERAAKWRNKVRQGDQVRLTRELVFHDKLVLVEAMGLGGPLAARCHSAHGDSGEQLLDALSKQVKALRNAVAHDSDALADEWSVWEWMRTTFELAEGLTASDR